MVLFVHCAIHINIINEKNLRLSNKGSRQESIDVSIVDIQYLTCTCMCI